MTELNAMPVGGCGRVLELGVDDGLGRRLRELGLCPGAELRCVGAAPLGDPRAYEFCGAVFALRQSDAKAILTDYV